MMTDRSRYLPEPADLDALLVAAGVSRGADTPTSDAALVAGRVRFGPNASGSEPAGTTRGNTPGSSDAADLAAGPPAPGELGLQFSGTASVEERLSALLRWVVDTTGAISAFVADGDGLGVANRETPHDTIAATACLSDIRDRLKPFVGDGVDGAVVVELDDDKLLEVIWGTTSAGRLAIGLVTAAPLERKQVKAMRRSLCRAFDHHDEGAA